MKDVIYQATVTPLGDLDEGDQPTPTLDEGDQPTPSNSGKQETYIGLASTKFKARLSNHNTTFKYQEKCNTTALSSHIWDLKRKGINYKLSWKIIDRGQQYSPISGICALCTCEKYQILFNPERGTLNKKTEIFGHCLHKSSKLLIKN